VSRVPWTAQEQPTPYAVNATAIVYSYFLTTADIKKSEQKKDFPIHFSLFTSAHTKYFTKKNQRASEIPTNSIQQKFHNNPISFNMALAACTKFPVPAAVRDST